jgi:anti-sigma factor RsiW
MNRREVDHRQAAELLGAFALDALEDDEASQVRDHVDRCGACQGELADHREVLSLLTTAWAPPPTGVWDRIASGLGDPPPPLDMSPVRALREARHPAPQAPAPGAPSATRRPGRGLGLGAVAAAAAVAVGLAGYGVIDTAPSGPPAVGPHAQELGRAAAAALVDPSARKVAMRSEDGGLSAEAVVLGDGAGYVLEDNLPPLDAGRTYQLWGIVEGTPVSLGLLGRSPEKFAFQVAGPVSALAITDEAEGGAVLPQADPLVLGALAP